MIESEREKIAGTIARRILAIRISRQVDQATIADALGSRTTRVTRIENGTSSLTATDLVLIARALGVPVSVVVGDQPATNHWEVADAS